MTVLWGEGSLHFLNTFCLLQACWDFVGWRLVLY